MSAATEHTGEKSPLDMLVERAGELARLLLKSPQPPRLLTSQYLHAKKRYDAAFKGQISALAHHALRCWRPAIAVCSGSGGDVDLAPSPETAQAACASSLLLALHDPAQYPLPEELLPLVADRQSATEKLLRMLPGHDLPDPQGLPVTQGVHELLLRVSSQPPAVAAALPDWVWARFGEEGHDTSDLENIALALRRAPPLTLRVNTRLASRESVLRALEATGLRAAAHPGLPAAIIVHDRVPLTDTALYEQGTFEVQDAGSQLIGYACGVQAGSRVFDACAGGGGKSMHLLDLTEDRGTLLAGDIERSKLRGLEKRAGRTGAHSLRTLAVTPRGDAARGGAPLPQHASFDCVLVDAPCSGFGTVRRNPALKWRLRERTVQRLAERQRDILARYADYVRPGGTLVYATCSLLPDENTHVVRDFLSTHPSFSPAPLSEAFSTYGITVPGLPLSASELTVSPALFDSDGFFIARFVRG